MAAQIIPVIMCGGAGTRLWPVSRESMPKQFVPLVGQESTFQQVLARVSDPELFARPIVLTKADFRFVVAEQLRERGVAADIVLEPMRRDSGPAVTVAAVLAAERDRNALVLVLAADHVIRKPEAFRDACRSAASAAAEGRIVTFGIEPTGPVTSYGYVRPGAKLNGTSVRAVEAPRSRCRDRRDLRRRSLPLQRQFPCFRVDADEIERFEPPWRKPQKPVAG
jgi:mannose-1-phosphate guanylyltransferase/mannose-6-phosphate isomerase